MLDFILNVMDSYAWSGLYFLKFILTAIDKIGYRSQEREQEDQWLLKKKKKSW